MCRSFLFAVCPKSATFVKPMPNTWHRYYYMYKITIDKDVINQMEVLTFEKPIHVIDSMLHLKAAVNVLRRAPLVGFDTETRPSFKKGDQHRMALIQLSTLDECFLFRVNRIGVPAYLASYLGDPTCKKVGLSLHDDFNGLSHVSHVKPQGFTELQDMVGKYHIADISLQKIYAILFDKKISKAQRLSNWEAPTLSPAQQQYAAIDAYTCIQIYNELQSGRFDPEKSPYKVLTDSEEQQ